MASAGRDNADAWMSGAAPDRVTVADEQHPAVRTI
jgi:hypothetical protein